MIRPLDENHAELVAFLNSNMIVNMPYATIAAFLNTCGWRSATWRQLTASHLSNFCRRKLGIRRVYEYKKPNYKGKNWHSFV